MILISWGPTLAMRRRPNTTTIHLRFWGHAQLQSVSGWFSQLNFVLNFCRYFYKKYLNYEGPIPPPADASPGHVATPPPISFSMKLLEPYWGKTEIKSVDSFFELVFPFPSIHGFI